MCKRKKSEVQIYLEQVEKLDALIENKLIERRQWKDLALKITANMDGERVQSSGSKSRMADAVDKCVDAEETVALTVDKLMQQKQEVLNTIEALYSPFWYKILHLKYIQHKTLETIAEEMDKSYTSITTAHGRALEAVSQILKARKS